MKKLADKIKRVGLIANSEKVNCRAVVQKAAALIVEAGRSVSSDKATADLMTGFYQKMLKQGQRPAAALRAAQVEMWKQKQWQSPYYWAAFVLQGEWR